MRAPKIAPTGVERTFGEDEVIVSKTDLKGIITYANDVFVRVSQFSEEELLGAPHNIIRHPAMPRCVFQYLWDTIEAGDEIFAYVVNLAKDGAHYWVFTHVTPTFGPSGKIIGYHSNRRTPYRQAITAVEPIYAALLAEEQRHTHTKEAIAASTRMLLDAVEPFGGYEPFVWSLEPDLETV